MITAAGFYKGRDVQFAKELTDDIRSAANHTIGLANQLLTAFYAVNPRAVQRDATSGWRPAAVNAATANASKTSLHMAGKAIDIADGDGALDAWCMTEAGQKSLTALGLYLEHPASTVGWTHVQTVAPRSGNRVFHP